MGLFFFAIALSALSFALFWLAQNWLSRWYVDRTVSRIISSVNQKATKPRPLMPESLFVLEVSDFGVRCNRPDGKVESVKWDDLHKVEILTTDQGPFVPDVFWVLYGSSDGCVIPWGATGEEELIKRLQSLPAFRNDLLINAASLTTNNRLVCWDRNVSKPVAQRD